MSASQVWKQQRASEEDVFIPLRRNFSFTHEPLDEMEWERFVARYDDLLKFVHRVMNSRGGTFLLTGYRGVGKTSFVNQAARAMRDHLSRFQSDAPLLDIHINLSNECTPTALMHTIVRRLHERLAAQDLLGYLESDLRTDIELAYCRTSFSLSRKFSDGTDVTMGGDIGFEGFGTKISLKTPIQRKTTRSRTLDASFLSYDDRAAEADIISIGQRLTKKYVESPPASRFGRLWRRLTRRYSMRRSAFRVMFVFDEIDKVEALEGAEGLSESPVAALLRALKSLFTASGFYFVFVAGRDLHDQFVIETAQGDSVFESVFSYDQYIPCLWSETRDICERLVDTDPLERHRCAKCRSHFDSGELTCSECGKYLRNPQIARQAFEQYIKYQTYRGRGIPRLLLRSIHSSITFVNDRPFLTISSHERKRQRAFAQLWDRLVASEVVSEYAIELGIQNTELDRRRLAMLYFVDWVLSNYDRPFTSSQSAAAVKSMSVKISRDSEPIVMLATSVKIGLVEELPENQNAVRAEGAELQYRVVSRWLLDIGSEPIPAMASTADSGDDFWITELVGVGGMSQVHLTLERRTGRQVALKLLTSHEEKATERFAQEAKLLRACCHPNIVRFISAGRFEGKPFLAMEYLDGVELRVILDSAKPLPTDVIIFIGQQASAGLAHLHEQKIFRNDIKPSNLIATSTGSVVVIDLGISKRDGDFDQFITRDGDLVGTPAYMAPEQFNGTPADTRSDVFSFGAIIYEAVTRIPVMPKVSSSAEAAAKAANLRIPSLNSGNSQLDRIVDRCLAADPSRRFQDMAAVAQHLAALKGSGSSGLRDLVSAVRGKRSSAKRCSDQATEMGTVVFPHAQHATSITQFFQRNATDPASNVSRLGAGEFTVILAGSIAVAFVTVMQGPDLKGQTLALRRPRTRIGRKLDSDIQLFSPRVSRNHAEVILGVKQAWIEDAGSTTGTYVDKVLLKPGVQAELKIGSTVRIGPYVLRFDSAA